jgi:hypothetical protein
MDFLLKQKTNRLIYLFFSPWLLILISPLVRLPIGNIRNAIMLLAFILWIQGCLFFFLTFVLGKKLIVQEDGKYNCIKNLTYLIHCLIDFLLFSMAIWMWIFAQINLISDNVKLPVFLIVLIAEIFRAKAFSKLIVSLELERETKLKDYVSTLYLLINPMSGIWNIHQRVKSLIKPEKSDSNPSHT